MKLSGCFIKVYSCQQEIFFLWVQRQARFFPSSLFNLPRSCWFLTTAKLEHKVLDFSSLTRVYISPGKGFNFTAVAIPLPPPTRICLLLCLRLRCQTWHISGRWRASPFSCSTLCSLPVEIPLCIILSTPWNLPSPSAPAVRILTASNIYHWLIVTFSYREGSIMALADPRLEIQTLQTLAMANHLCDLGEVLPSPEL